ncbi:MAG: hypothetical protein KH230_24065 [Enterocloster asparagiformis]|nr:hypothetical protein [Enterocloster asparagiformis]
MQKNIGLVVPGKDYGQLTAHYYWNAKSGRVWKCTCKCGNICFVKERALISGIVNMCKECQDNQYVAVSKKAQ